MTTIENIRTEYPLHWAVWNDDHKELQDLLKTNQVSAIVASISLYPYFHHLTWLFVDPSTKARLFISVFLFSGCELQADNTISARNQFYRFKSMIARNFKIMLEWCKTTPYTYKMFDKMLIFLMGRTTVLQLPIIYFHAVYFILNQQFRQPIFDISQFNEQIVCNELISFFRDWFTFTSLPSTVSPLLS